MKTEDWEEKSPQVKKLILSMICVDENQRLTANEVLLDPWFGLQSYQEADLLAEAKYLDNLVLFNVTIILLILNLFLIVFNILFA
jgi:hypothetical protein